MPMDTAVDNEAVDAVEDENFTLVIPSLARPANRLPQKTPPKPTLSPGRLSVPARVSAVRSPQSVGDNHRLSLSSQRSSRVRSPDRPSTRGTDAQEEVQIYEDPVVGENHDRAANEMNKPVLEELPLDGKSNEQPQPNENLFGDSLAGSTELPLRALNKPATTENASQGEMNEKTRAEILKNRQLLASGINKIRNRTVEAHMFRRMQDMIKSNQEIWGTNDEKFGELLLASLEYLEAPPETLKAPYAKTANLKVQALATVRAMLSLYRKETAKYFAHVLCTLLHTKAQYENTSHIATDLEATADEIVKYGQTSDCLNAVLALLERSPASSPASSPNSSTLGDNGTPAPAANRTVTMGLTTLASLIEISAVKNISLSSDQTSQLGKLAVKCLDDIDADVRKAAVEVCIALHYRIGGEKDSFWKIVAGAREQHLNLLTFYLAKRSNEETF